MAAGLTQVLAETTAGETITYWHALDTLAQSDGSTTEYFSYDGLGSVRQLVDETGSVTLAQTFDPYGTGYATSGSASSRLGWTGEQVDGNGFVFLRARYYAPGMGRFTQMDPSRQERNAYEYGASNPILFVDLSGLLVCTDPSAGGVSPSHGTAYNYCIDAIQDMESTYGVVFLWPNRTESVGDPSRNLPILIDKIAGTECPSSGELGYVNSATGVRSVLQHWETNDIVAISRGLQFIRNVFPASYWLFTRNGAFFRTNDLGGGDERGKLWYGSSFLRNDNPPREYTTEITNTAIDYIVGFGPNWVGRSDTYDKTRTLIHELGHYVDYLYLKEEQLVENMCRKYLSSGKPVSGKTYSNAGFCSGYKEYFADTFARYVFEQQTTFPSGGDPFKNFGSGSKDLDDIYDAPSPMAAIGAHSLAWYMRHRMLIKIPGFKP